jgi:hypothetical protein
VDERLSNISPDAQSVPNEIEIEKTAREKNKLRHGRHARATTRQEAWVNYLHRKVEYNRHRLEIETKEEQRREDERRARDYRD